MARILALIGSTASGKSEVALELARRHHAEILSCDSLLVYRDLTIGTAKPTADEMAGVLHHGIDIRNLDETFTAGDYVRYARPIIDDLVKRDKPLLIVGGTGFYLKGLLCGVWDAPPTQPEIRARIEKEVEHLTKEEQVKTLYARLEKADPEYAAKVKPNDVYRVVRALEIIEATGSSVTSMLAKRVLQNPLPYPFTILGIQRNKLDLERRIAERTNSMFSKGLVAETKELLAKYNPPPRPFYCVGYNEVLQFLDNKLSLPECRERVTIATRQLAKKQKTFFSTFPSPITWYTLPAQNDEFMEAADRALL